MSNITRIAGLKEKIRGALLPLIDQDYSLLDAPNHNNIGDSLIYEGELAFLKEVAAQKLFSANRKFATSSRIPQKGIILMHGGGNFGDLWRVYQDFRTNVIRERIHQKIIIFPQTVHYEDEGNLLQDAEIFNNHPNLTICARDQRSYDLLKKYFYNNNILLVPDMAFYLDLSSYIKNEKTGKVLLLKRVDKELQDSNNDLEQKITKADQQKEIEVADWPGIQYTEQEKKYWRGLEKKNKYLTKINLLVSSAKGVNLDFGVMNLFNSQEQLVKGCEFINQYDAVYSTRLHGAILTILLNKPVYILDNSYGKNSQFFNCWLKDFENCVLID